MFTQFYKCDYSKLIYSIKEVQMPSSPKIPKEVILQNALEIRNFTLPLKESLLIHPDTGLIT